MSYEDKSRAELVEALCKAEARLASLDDEPSTTAPGNDDNSSASGASQRLARALQESNERFQSMFERHDAVMLLIDPRSGRILDANLAASRFYGYSKLALRSMSINDINTLPAAQVAEERRRAVEEQRNYFVFKHQMASGARRVVEVHSSPIPFAGETVLFSIVHDITDRTQVEQDRERLMSAIEQAAEIIVIAGGDGTIRYVNPAFEQISGYPRADALGKNLQLLDNGEARGRLHEELLDVLGRGEVWRGRLVNRKRDGTMYTTEATISPVKDSDGETVDYVAVARDITQVLGLEAQLLQSRKMEAIGRLAGGVAHDFNNVLTIISGHVALAQRDTVNGERTRASLTVIEQAADRASDLTRQLLAFSRKQVVETRVVHLGRLVAEVHAMLDGLIGEHIELSSKQDCASGCARVDPNQLEQVVINLALNARDAMPSGGFLSIETADVVLDDAYASLHQGTTPGSYVMVAVSDTGSGMNSETRERVFEPFFTTKELGQGTGLGLASVLGIVEQNNGRIEVYSEPGEGSCFKVYFPSVNESEAPSRRPSESPARGKGTLLVAEDEEQVRKIAVELLQSLGYEVLSADCGQEALDLAETHPRTIDLLLTDVIMPGMNGRELADRLLARRPEVRVLYTSGYTQDVMAQRGVLGEGAQFMAKPYSLDALATKIDAMLRSRK